MEVRASSIIVPVLILWQINGGCTYRLETDCTAAQTTTATEMPSEMPIVAEFPFRTDRMTSEECRRYKNLIPCSPVWGLRNCDHVRDDDLRLSDPRSKTYLVIECSERDRSEMVELTRNVSGESPLRAVTVRLKERNGTGDPVHSAVFEPIRRQVIAFTVECETQLITSKVYAVGVLPNLVDLWLQSCRNLTIRKQDFTRLPRILTISFQNSTIEELERDTFTNLASLQALQMEGGIAWQLQLFQDQDRRINPEDFKKWDVEKVRRLHCDCSFTWLRNFLRKKPDLSDEKTKGEIFIIGNYMSPALNVKLSGFNTQFLSVDCTRHLSVSSIHAGTEFSYNTTCYDAC